MWDERYAQPGYAYGTEPNEFLRQVAPKLSVGHTLCLAEGEGRNAVFLAGLGHRVTAVDSSAVGLGKARALASLRAVVLETVQADLAQYSIEPAAWDAVVAIFAHLPGEVRTELLRQAVQGLRPGGGLVLEAYSRAQVDYDTGGPPWEDYLYDLDSLKTNLDGIQWEIARETVREIREGRCHTGPGAVVQVLGWRRGPA